MGYKKNNPCLKKALDDEQFKQAYKEKDSKILILDDYREILQPRKTYPPNTRICVNCMSFDADKNQCTIRYIIAPDKTRSPLPRKPGQMGCEVFLSK